VPTVRLLTGMETRRETRAVDGTITGVFWPLGEVTISVPEPEIPVTFPPIIIVPEPLCHTPPRPCAAVCGPDGTSCTERAMSVPSGAFVATTRTVSPVWTSARVACWRLSMRVEPVVWTVTERPPRSVKAKEPSDTDAMDPKSP
jgi:hypothetical protein